MGDAAVLMLALEAFLGEHRRCWRLHGDGLELDGAWMLCGCGAALFVREPTHRVPGNAVSPIRRCARAREMTLQVDQTGFAELKLVARRRHHAGSKFPHNFFPHFGVVTDMGNVHLVQHQASRLRPLIVTNDTILIQKCTLG